MNIEEAGLLLGAAAGIIFALCILILNIRMIGAILCIPRLGATLERIEVAINKIEQNTRPNLPSMPCPNCGADLPGSLVAKKKFKCPVCKELLEIA